MDKINLESMAYVSHPLPLGTRILSVNGECDEGEMSWDESGATVERKTGPNAELIVTSHLFLGGLQGWSYGVESMPSEVLVFLDEVNFAAAPENYLLIELGNGEEPQLNYDNNTFRDADVLRQIEEQRGD